MIWKRIFGRSAPDKDAAYLLYAQVVKQARSVEFYTRMGAPDTLEGRFELVTLHAFLLLHRLKNAGKQAKDLAQAVFDVLFDDMDQVLRELGVGDLSVGKKIKSMAELFYGRMNAYDAGMAASDDALEQAIRRIVFAEMEPAEDQVKALAAYMRLAVSDLARQPVEDILSGVLRFPAPLMAEAEGEA